ESSVQDVPYAQLKERLLADGQALSWAGSGKTPESLEGIVIDNSAATVTGNWNSSTSINGYVAYDYLHDDNTEKGTKTITFTTRLPKTGRYEIRMWATASGNRATNVPVTLNLGKDATTLSVDQRNGPSAEGVIRLGVFTCPADTDVTATIATTDTNGYVVADAVQFVPVP
ncbi:MAG: FAD-dependent oxidoreductase, partial [Pirellulales bacterium]